jgi:endo-1,4-beta-xylanase
MPPKRIPLIRPALLLGLLSLLNLVFAAEATLAAAPAAPSPVADSTPVALPPLPPKMNVPAPGPVTDAPYAPQPILQGGVVVPLYPPGSPYLKMDRVKEAEKYNMSGNGMIGSIVNIHNPSIEFHPGSGSLNTGTAIIVVAGGGHRTLNVGGEGADFVPFFFNHGINTVILRNRMRVDGYDAKTDSVYDAQQAIKIVRAYAKEWKLDPNKIGIMGFSAGAELATPAAISWKEFDEKNNVPGNPFAAISSRPDFVGVIYPGPTPFAAPRGPDAAKWTAPAIPKDTPPSFIVCAGWGDRVHAIWANEWFTAMLNANIPNVEMHIYARGRHPGDTPNPGDPPSTGGLTNRGFIAYGTWQDRFIEWSRDLGFMGKPGVETQAARDVIANVNRPPPSAGRRGGGGAAGAPGAAAPAAATPTTPAPAGQK